MTLEERLSVAESTIGVVADNLAGLMCDVAKLVADKHDIAQLRCQVDSLTSEVTMLSNELQIIRAVSE